MDLFPPNTPLLKKIFLVGRLDKDTQGLLLLTNDGQLAHRPTHPKWKVPKVYLVTLDKPLSREVKEMIEPGVELRNGPTKPCLIKVRGLLT